ncbi:MAG: hypothetical protein U5J64_11545 [Halobacteriales archaeon]|nr:hypothetical protein [Halobacteriales archaeon]
MVETTLSIRTPSKAPYFHAIVAVGVVSVFFSVLAFLNSGAMGAVSGAVYAFLLASPVVGFGVFAWHRGCRVTVVPTVSFFVLFLLLSSYVSTSSGVNIDASDLFFVPVLFSVFIVGAELSLRERDEISGFLSSRTGVVSVVAGVTHAIVGMAIQFRARPQVISDLLEVDLRPPLLEILGLFGFVLLVVALVVVVVLPAFLMHSDGLLFPVAVLTGWISLGALLNYYWWDIYPLSPGAETSCSWSYCFVYQFPLSFGDSETAVFPFPAPDYAVMVYVPLLLMLLTAVFEGYMRNKP